MLSFFPRGVLDEILNLIESVSEGFPSYTKASKFNYSVTDHVIVRNLKIISDLGIRHIVSKCPNYWFPFHMNLIKCREEITSAWNEFGDQWRKRASCFRDMESNHFQSSRLT